jgi:hypothetical protein
MTILVGWSAAAGGFAAAPLGAHGIYWGVANQLGCHYARYKELPAVVVEIDRGAFGIGFGHGPETILLVFDLLSSGKNLHVASLSRLPLPGLCFPRTLLSGESSSCW